MSFYTAVVKPDPRFHSINICRDVDLLEPGMRAAVAGVIADAHAAGHDLRIAETFRSAARQVHLFEQGFSQLRNVGVHNYGLACDFNLFVDGVYESDGEKYTFLVDLAKAHGLISGIDWGSPHLKHSFRDWDHVQRVPVQMQGQLFRGAWYPGEDYSPYPYLEQHGLQP
jgi:hypothetical protein